VGDGRTLWRAFDNTVRRKPLAGATDAAYGFSIDFRLEIIAKSGIRHNVLLMLIDEVVLAFTWIILTWGRPRCSRPQQIY
jgi:hypothetical protein